jgi:hypothetical protein
MHKNCHDQFVIHFAFYHHYSISQFSHFLTIHTTVLLISLAVVTHTLLYWLYRSQWDQCQSFNGIKFLQ